MRYSDLCASDKTRGAAGAASHDAAGFLGFALTFAWFKNARRVTTRTSTSPARRCMLAIAVFALSGTLDVDVAVLGALRATSHLLPAETIGRAVLAAAAANAAGRHFVAALLPPIYPGRGVGLGGKRGSGRPLRHQKTRAAAAFGVYITIFLATSSVSSS